MILTGTEQDMKQLFMQRKNVTFYATLIDYYGPCVVQAKKWNNVALVKTACGRGETNDKFEELFTTSDEAFLRRWSTRGKGNQGEPLAVEILRTRASCSGTD